MCRRLAIRRAAGTLNAGADVADIPPGAIAALVESALHDAANAAIPAPAPLLAPQRPEYLRCTALSGLAIRANSVYGTRLRMPLDCRRCPNCREWRRQLTAARFDAGRAPGQIGAVAQITGFQSPAAAAAAKKSENRTGTQRFTAIDRDGDGDGYTLTIAYLDTLPAADVAAMQKRMASPARAGLSLELDPARYITADDIADWTPDAKRWYPDDYNGGWTYAKPDDWYVGRRGAINAIGFSRHWPARAFQLPPTDYALSDGRLLTRDDMAPGTESDPALDERVESDRLTMDWHTRTALYAYIWRDGKPPPPPALWAAVEDAVIAGDFNAAKTAARAVKTATGIRCHTFLLIDTARAGARPAAPVYQIMREWIEGLAEPPPPDGACAGCGKRPAIPGGWYCLRCDGAPLLAPG